MEEYALMEVLLGKLVEQNELTKEEIMYFLKNLTPDFKHRLYILAAQTRKKHYNESVFCEA